MNNYTVLLLRPDYIASQYGEDTYLAHVVANGVLQAQVQAQSLAYEADNEGCTTYEIEDHRKDYAVLFVAMGHLKDLAEGETSEGETR